MNIKTISQLTPLGDEAIQPQAYFGVSQYCPADDGGKYFSRKVQYSQLRDQISGYIDEKVLGDLYKMKNSLGPISVYKMRDDVDSLKRNNMSIDGIKTFTSTPRIASNVSPDNPTNVPNVQCVNELIAKHAGFMTDGQYLDMDPGNGTQGYTTYDETDPNPKQMYWHIDHGQRDSSLWKDEYGAVAGPVTCLYTGNLVCYGWLADNGSVRPETAWVGMFGRVKCGNDMKWVALQIQPWIIGRYSSTAQYVGFNLPVKAGLQLKIMTGFGVNGNNTGLTDKPTLMFSDGNMPNTFVGYILRTM